MRERVLLVGPFPPTVGGITSFIEKILNSELKETYEFIPFTTSRPTSGATKDVTDYSILLKMNPRILVGAAFVTLYHLTKYPFVLVMQNPKLVHIHTTDYLPFLESSVYVLAAKLFSKRTIIHIHATAFQSFYDNGNPATKAIIRKILKRTDSLIVLSPNARTFFKKIAPDCRVSIVPNAIETYSSERELIHGKSDSDDVKVLFVGGDEAKRKGLFDVLKVIPKVVDKFGPNIIFLFAGRYDKEKEKAIGNAGNQYHCVRNLGFLEKNEMLKTRLTSDIYILPSYAEGLPMAMLEAMAAGLPVVSTKVGSIPELIEEGVNGFLIKPGDYEMLAERIVQLAEDRKLRREMGEKNIEKVKRSYSLERTTQELDKIYRSL